jgi:hypothetical protein
VYYSCTFMMFSGFEIRASLLSRIRIHAVVGSGRVGEIEIVYNMYRMRRLTPNTVCAGCRLRALPTMPYMELTSQG